MHEIIFSNRLILHIEEVNAILMKIIGERMPQAATHLALSKKLIASIGNTRNLPAITICVYSTNCYDRVSFSLLVSACNTLD